MLYDARVVLIKPMAIFSKIIYENKMFPDQWKAFKNL